MELQKLLQDEIREGLYRITISGPRGDSEVSKVRIRPVEIKGKLLFQCQETVGTKEFHKNMTKDDVITRISDWMNGTFKQMQLESDTCTASVLVSKKGTMTIKKKPHMKGTGKPVNLAHNRKKRYILEEGIPVPFLQDLGVMTKEGKIVRTRYDKFRQINRFLEFIEDILPQLPSDREITILDFGCGGGFPGIPLAILFPECKFKLIDGTGKKIRVCNEVATAINLQNLKAEHLRGEDEKGKYDFVVSRAVMQLPDLMKIIKKNFKQKGQNALPNGLLCLKGGNLKEELKQYFKISEITPLSTFFDEEWFSQDKQLVYVPA